MKKLLTYLVVAVLACGISLAGDRPTELTTGAAFTDADNIKAYSLNFAWEFPLGTYMQLGPLVGGTYVDPDGVGKLGVYDAGLIWTFNFSKVGSGPYAAVSALAHFGDIATSYTAVPEVGLKFGNDAAFLRVGLAQPYQLNSDRDNLIDLERTEVVMKLGLRF